MKIMRFAPSAPDATSLWRSKKFYNVVPDLRRAQVWHDIYSSSSQSARMYIHHRVED
ncbi:hypothetical protein [Dictyobacter formicarum]|uniref:hypothetical protein n=1 Tax=Dictyobacter formicarum TaxID=2778368 RepID=UPI001915C5D1|nr:hypothetical protein [Dictyobacter formicarum]